VAVKELSSVSYGRVGAVVVRVHVPGGHVREINRVGPPLG
jgi:hypothetical protein